MNKLYKAIVLDLKKHGDKKVADADKYYHKYERYESYGIKMPILRELLRKYKKDVQALNCKTAMALAQKLFASHIEEQILAGNYVLQTKRDCLNTTQFDFLDKALSHFR